VTTTIGGQTSINLLDLISDADDNLVLFSLIVLVQPTSGAPTTITNGILLIDYTGINFTGTDELTIQVCDVFGECTQQQIEVEVIGDIEIYNAVSPNNDGLNDIFYIEYINLIPETQNNTVSIFNRWGSKVFEVEDYNNNDKVFKGLNENGNELPSGTYFYQIAFDSGKKQISGYLALKR
jgi:gliding motility-associated-like protein